MTFGTYEIFLTHPESREPLNYMHFVPELLEELLGDALITIVSPSNQFTEFLSERLLQNLRGFLLVLVKSR